MRILRQRKKQEEPAAVIFLQQRKSGVCYRECPVLEVHNDDSSNSLAVTADDCGGAAFACAGHVSETLKAIGAPKGSLEKAAHSLNSSPSFITSTGTRSISPPPHTISDASLPVSVPFSAGEIAETPARDQEIATIMPLRSGTTMNMRSTSPVPSEYKPPADVFFLNTGQHRQPSAKTLNEFSEPAKLAKQTRSLMTRNVDTARHGSAIAIFDAKEDNTSKFGDDEVAGFPKRANMLRPLELSGRERRSAPPTFRSSDCSDSRLTCTGYDQGGTDVADSPTTSISIKGIASASAVAMMQSDCSLVEASSYNEQTQPGRQYPFFSSLLALLSASYMECITCSDEQCVSAVEFQRQPSSMH